MCVMIRQFCRETLKFGTFCRENVVYALWTEKFALRADPAVYPALIPKNTQENPRAKKTPENARSSNTLTRPELNPLPSIFSNTRPNLILNKSTSWALNFRHRPKIAIFVFNFRLRDENRDWDNSRENSQECGLLLWLDWYFQKEKGVNFLNFLLSLRNLNGNGTGNSFFQSRALRREQDFLFSIFCFETRSINRKSYLRQ